MVNIVFIILGLIFLVKGADFLIDGASNIARKFKISEFVIGLTVIAVGTSLPELMVSIQSILKGSPDLLVGNIVGSCICNLLLILGIISIIKPIKIQKDSNILYIFIIKFQRRKRRKRRKARFNYKIYYIFNIRNSFIKIWWRFCCRK